MPTAPHLRLLVSVIPAGLLLAFASCSSESDRPEPPLHAMPEFPPSMAGTETFADGRLAVQVTLGQQAGRGSRGEGGPGSGGGSSSGHHGGGHRGGGMGMGGGEGGGRSSGDMGGEGGYSAGMPGGSIAGGTEVAEAAPTGDAGPRRGPMPGGQGTAQLKLHFINTSATDAVSCEVLDFKSALGDFAVFPAKYQIAAGQSAASEIMTSQLGVNSAEIPVTVVLLIGGHKETKVVTLKLLPKPAPPAPEPTSVGK